jgi:hypothetical protein
MKRIRIDEARQYTKRLILLGNYFIGWSAKEASGQGILFPGRR